MSKLSLVAIVATVAAVKVTPAGNVPANPVLTAGAAPGNQPRWGSRYPVIPAKVESPINWAVPSTKTKAGPLGGSNGDSQSFFANSFAEVTPAGNVPANPALTAGAAPGNQPRWGSRYPVIPAKVESPINWAVPSTKTKAGPLGGSNGDSQSFYAHSFAEVTPAGNVPANPALTAGAAPGNQPRWGSRYPVIPAKVESPINWAVPSTKTKAGPLGGSNGDSQSFISQSLAEVTPAGNVPANPALTAGAAPGNQPRWGSRYPVIPAKVATPINWAVPSTKTKAGPLGGSNGDSQSFFANSFAEVTPAGNVPANPVLTAGAAPGNQPRWGSRYPVIPAKVATPINWAVPSTKTMAGPLGGSNGDSQSFINVRPEARVTPDHPVYPPALTAGAPADGSKPRFGTAYNLNHVTPDHPEFKPELTAGAPVGDAQPRFGSAYRGYNAVQKKA